MLRLFIWYFVSSTEVVAVSQLAINYAKLCQLIVQILIHNYDMPLILRQPFSIEDSF